MDVVLPKVALTMDEATIVEWLVAAGDHVTAGQHLFSMETDKATVDVEAPATGVLTEILHPEGSLVGAGEVVARLEADDTSLPQREIPTAERAVAPAAAELAELLGIDLATVTGSGPGGRVLEADIMKANQGGAAAATRSASTASLEEPATQPAQISKARAAGLHLTERVGQVPTFVLTRTLDFSGLTAGPSKVSVTDVITVASARALKAVPACHSRLHNSEVRSYTRPRIGVLIRSGDALVPLVFEDPSEQTPASVRDSRRELVEQLDKGHLEPKHLWWPTFVVSNLGRYEVESFSAVLFPETAATLALGSLGIGGPDGSLKATLTCDHRLIDGIDAAQFMAQLASDVAAVIAEAEQS